MHQQMLPHLCNHTSRKWGLWCWCFKPYSANNKKICHSIGRKRHLSIDPPLGKTVLLVTKSLMVELIVKSIIPWPWRKVKDGTSMVKRKLWLLQWPFHDGQLWSMRYQITCCGHKFFVVRLEEEEDTEVGNWRQAQINHVLWHSGSSWTTKWRGV